MFIVFEISTPLQIKPGFYHSDFTIFRVWWLWFAISLHPMRFDEMINDASRGIAAWCERSH